MAFENVKVLPGTQTADANLSTKQFFAVKITSTGIAIAVADNRAFPLQNKPESGQQCEVGYEGVSKVISGAAFARGIFLTTDANGKYITAVSGDKICGIALSAASKADVLASMLIVQDGEVA